MNLKFNCSDNDWARFCGGGLVDYFETSNVKGDFGKLSKKFGAAYLCYLNAAYLANNLPIEEFCRINGDVPVGFLNRFK